MKTDEITTYKRRLGKQSGLPAFLTDSSITPAIMSLMISRVTVMGNMAPFGMAWYAANITCDKFSSILIASLAGTLLISNPELFPLHAFSLILMFIFKKIIVTPLWKNPAFTAAICALSLFLPGMAYSFFSGTFYFTLLNSTCDSLIAGGMCVIFSKSALIIRRNWKISSDEDSVAVAILAGCMVAGLQGISLYGIKPANLLSMYIILFTAYKGGIGISGAVGTALGLIAGISQGDSPALIGVYGFMGLLSGTMNIFGKTGVVLSSAFANAVFSSYYNSSTIVLVNLFEIAVAGIFFLFTPERILCYFEKFSIPSPVYVASGGYVMRLKNSVGEALASLRNSAVAIAEAYTPAVSSDNSASEPIIKERLIARVCDGCSLNKYCWSKNINGTNSMFRNITSALTREKPEEISECITGRCVRGDTLCETAKELYSVMKREEIIKKRIDLYAEKFSDGWSDFLEIISAKQEKIANIKPDFAVMESDLSRELASGGIKNPEISIIMNEMGRFEITIRSSKEILFDIIPFTSKLTGRKMCISDEYHAKNGFVLKLQEGLRFDYDVSIITMNKHGSELSGDSAEWFVTPEGIFYCIICDGMGSGDLANEDSKKTIKLFKTLILSGFSPCSVLKIINGGMISSGDDERCVTFDCLSVDLFSGKADFTKAGAVASVLKTGRDVSLIRENTIPLGVLDIDSAPHQSLFLGDDSYIVMMSDGITDNVGDRKKGEECVANIMKLMEVSGSKEIADNIMMSAVAEGIPRDDMMVTAIKISRKDT